MNRIVSLPVIVLVVASFAPASAALFQRDWKTPGDGLLTYDDVNQREWLDLTETQLSGFSGDTLEERYDTVLVQLMQGGEFAGFEQATSGDVFLLADSSGIDTTTTSFAINQEASNSLIELLGNPVLGAAALNKWAAGFLSDGVLSTSLAIAFVPSSRAEPVAGITPTNFLGSSNGIWLHREVPEPASSALFASAVTVSLIRQIRRRRSFIRSLGQHGGHPSNRPGA